jgi:hypothetical protein
MPDKIIVKLQRSQASSQPEEMCLMYDENKTVITEIPYGAISRKVHESMDTRQKGFFYAVLIDGKWVPSKQAPWQNW